MLKDWVNSHIQNNDVLLVVEEIFINIAQYGYPEGYAEDPFVDITLTITKEGLELQFVDKGVEFNPKTYKRNKPLEEPGGYGIFLVNQKMDSIDYERREDKNILTVKKTNRLCEG